MREQVDHARLRAVVQAMLDKDKALTAFNEDYMKTAFPWLATVRAREKDANVAMLKEWLAKGPMVATPLNPAVVTSRVKSKKIQRVAAAPAGPMTPEQKAKIDRLYEQMSKTRSV